MTFMREVMAEFQEETGNIYNLEATPAESTAYRFARIDTQRYPDIITANQQARTERGAKPYYTNSTHLPVGYSDDIYEVLEKQDPLQTLYTGGTVLHIFTGEHEMSPESAKRLVRKVTGGFRLPYITISPSFSVCPQDGYLSGEHFTCPKCGRSAEVYSRIVGYMRPVSQWNEGKREEFRDRRLFRPDDYGAGGRVASGFLLLEGTCGVRKRYERYGEGAHTHRGAGETELRGLGRRAVGGGLYQGMQLPLRLLSQSGAGGAGADAGAARCGGERGVRLSRTPPRLARWGGGYGRRAYATRRTPRFSGEGEALGYRVKLDTNGTNPEMLRQLIASGAVDFVAMDIKHFPDAEHYGAVTPLSQAMMDNVLRSIGILRRGGTEYELRTTLLPGIHTPPVRETLRRMFADCRYVFHEFRNTGPDGLVADYPET